MKKTFRVFSIGLMTMFLSLETSLLYSQSKGKTIKKESMYVCNIDSPKQVAVSGKPAWVLNTMFFLFEDGKKGGMGGQSCVYAINTYNGGLGEAIATNVTEAVPFSYREKNGLVYVWDLDDTEPEDDSGYFLILSIEDDEYLTPIKTSQQNMLKLSKLVYVGNYKEIKAMSDREVEEVEKYALTKLLFLRDQATSIELMESFEASTDSIYKEVDEMPTYPGGERALMEHVARNVRYPIEAIEKGIQGRVFVGFVVEKDGSISNIEVLKGIGDVCDAEAVRVVKSMKRWKPGRNKGKLVRVSLMLPVSFKLG